MTLSLLQFCCACNHIQRNSFEKFLIPKEFFQTLHRHEGSSSNIATTRGGCTCISGVQMNPLTSKKKKKLYIYKIFINLITFKNIFAQFGLNLAHPDPKSI